MAAIDGDSWFYEKLSKWPHDDDDIILLSAPIYHYFAWSRFHRRVLLLENQKTWVRLVEIIIIGHGSGWCGRWASSTSLRCSVESRWINQRWRRGGRCQRMNQWICVGGFMNRWSTQLGSDSLRRFNLHNSTTFHNSHLSLTQPTIVRSKEKWDTYSLNIGMCISKAINMINYCHLTNSKSFYNTPNRGIKIAIVLLPKYFLLMWDT